MLKNVYAMIGAEGKILSFTPMSPTEMFAFGEETKAEAEEWMSNNPDISFVQEVDYELMEAYYWPDGTLDMFARYLGEPCGAEGCECENKPYSYFINGKMAQVLNDEDLELLRMMIVLTGGEPIDLDMNV